MGLHSFKLSKILIAVIGFVILGAGEMVSAQTALTMPSTGFDECIKKNTSGSYTEESTTNALKICEHLQPGYTNECEEKQTAFEKAKGEFNQSCLSSGDKCYDDALACTACKGDKLPSYCPGGLDPAEERKARAAAIKAKMTGPTTTVKSNAARIGQINSCPSVGMKHVEELKKDVEDEQDKNEGLIDDLNSAVEDLQTAEGEAKQAQADLKAELEELTNDRDEAEKKLKADTIEEMKAKRKEYDELNDQISQLTLKIQEINMQKIEALSQAELKCHNQALEQLSVFLKDRRAALNASQLSAGSLKNLFSSAGPTRKDKNANFANKYYVSCLEDTNHINRINTIKRAHALQLETINQSINSARAGQMKLIQEISGEETQAKFKEALEWIYKQHQRKTQKAEEAFLAKMQIDNAKIEGLKRKIQELQKRRDESSLKLRNKIAIYGTADERSGGLGKDDPQAKFLDNYGSLRSKAEDYLLSCCSGGTNNGTCKPARTAYCADKTSADLTGDDGLCSGETSRQGKLLERKKSGSTK
ncbi:MAG: hypothetical protein KDD38_00505 [Bdellovibrionales bacterium]|nr:hypothetical protein [Bdellovibrionales bacterium]